MNNSITLRLPVPLDPRFQPEMNGLPHEIDQLFDEIERVRSWGHEVGYTDGPAEEWGHLNCVISYDDPDVGKHFRMLFDWAELSNPA